MITPTMPRNLSFRVDTMFASKGGRVGIIKPDENGVYRGMPMMVLGEVTQQKTYYDPASIVDQITNPETHFNMVLRQQKKGGEYGHPQFYGMSNEDQLQRLHTVEESNTSHLFTSLYTDTPVSGGNMVVRADIKPSGPMGPVLKESLDDPMENTAFSLRAYVSTQMRPNGIKERFVRKLITFDTVRASGYATTDKAHAIGLESFAGDNYQEHEIHVMDNGTIVIDQIALESFSNTDLNEIFGVANISQIIQTRTFVKADASLLDRFPNTYINSIFNEYFREG